MKYLWLILLAAGIFAISAWYYQRHKNAPAKNDSTPDDPAGPAISFDPSADHGGAGGDITDIITSADARKRLADLAAELRVKMLSNTTVTAGGTLQTAATPANNNIQTLLGV